MVSKTDRIVTKEENELLVATMTAIRGLAQIYNSGLSIRAVKGRMIRIAEDLRIAAEKPEEQ